MRKYTNFFPTSSLGACFARRADPETAASRDNAPDLAPVYSVHKFFIVNLRVFLVFGFA